MDAFPDDFAEQAKKARKHAAKQRAREAHEEQVRQHALMRSERERLFHYIKDELLRKNTVEVEPSERLWKKHQLQLVEEIRAHFPRNTEMLVRIARGCNGEADFYDYVTLRPDEPFPPESKLRLAFY